MAGTPTATDRFLTVKELSEYLNVPVKTIYDWRYKGLGPKTTLLVGSLRYRLSDVTAWLEAQPQAVAR